MFFILIFGKYNVMNVMVVIVVGVYFGIMFEDVVKGLSGLKVIGMRFEFIKIDSGILIINDVYNVSLIFMKVVI